MLAKRSRLPGILAVNIHRQAPAYRRRLRAWDHRRPPAIREAMAPDVADGDACLHANHAGLWLPLQNVSHVGEIQHDSFVVEGSIIITVASSSQRDGGANLAGQG